MPQNFLEKIFENILYHNTTTASIMPLWQGGADGDKAELGLPANAQGSSGSGF
jgi:hypothetical protein